jgi:regulatory protein
MPASGGEHPSPPKPVFLTALRLLAAKRLTRAQLAKKLRDRGFADEVIREAVAECERRRYLDDRTFAQLFVANALERKPVGPMRLVRELIKQGVDGDLAREMAAQADSNEDERIDRAIEKFEASRPGERFDRLARRLYALGYTPSAVSRALRRRAAGHPNVVELEELP